MKPVTGLLEQVEREFASMGIVPSVLLLANALRGRAFAMAKAAADSPP